jgi:hypothetical protein
MVFRIFLLSFFLQRSLGLAQEVHSLKIPYQKIDRESGHRPH